MFQLVEIREEIESCQKGRTERNFFAGYFLATKSIDLDVNNMKV
jgi:hypothetical protein